MSCRSEVRIMWAYLDIYYDLEFYLNKQCLKFKTLKWAAWMKKSRMPDNSLRGSTEMWKSNVSISSSLYCDINQRCCMLTTILCLTIILCSSLGWISSFRLMWLRRSKSLTILHYFDCFFQLIHEQILPCRCCIPI